MAIQFICTADGGDGSVGGELGSNVADNKTLGGTLLNANERRVEALVRFELFAPGQGWPWFVPRYTMRVRGLDHLALEQGANTIPLGFPANANDTPGTNPDSINGGLGSGGSFLPAQRWAL